MKTLPYSTYHTRSGLVALTIDLTTLPDGTSYYSYTGKHGAGSGHPLAQVQSTVRTMLQTRRGIRLVTGNDILEPDEVIECAFCDRKIWFRDSWSPGDDAICAECDTEVTGRPHPPSLDPDKDPPPTSI